MEINQITNRMKRKIETNDLKQKTNSKEKREQIKLGKESKEN